MNIFLSPHQDDVVLSCGGLLKKEAGNCLVVTVFAGKYSGLTPWDRFCGFSDNTSPWMIRNSEDRVALGMLGANCVQIDVLQHRFLRKAVSKDSVPYIKSRIACLISQKERCKRVYAPLGVANRDHELVRNLVLEAFVLQQRDIECELVFYEDFPYIIKREWADKAHGYFRRNNIDLTPHCVDVTEQLTVKVNAIMAYKSQIDWLMISQFPDMTEWILKNSRASVAGALRLYSGIAAGDANSGSNRYLERYWVLSNMYREGGRR